MNWSLFILVNSSPCCVVTLVSMSSSPPSIITIRWQVHGFFFCGELGRYGLNQSMGVDGLVHIFTHCDYQISHGDMSTERTDCRSLMSCSMVTTLGKGSLYCCVVIFFSSFPWIGCGFGESTSVSSSDKGN
jgi:hypothetical protein